MMELNKCLPGPAKTISDTLPRSTTLEKCEYKKALGFLNRRVKLARSIIGRTYSMHPLRNAFNGVPFGAKKHGILVATTEDHLHACESGMMLNLAEVAYGGLTQAESKVFEQIIQSKVTTCQSSVLSELPHGITKKNFGNITLCSHKEKVGIVYYLQSTIESILLLTGQATLGLYSQTCLLSLPMSSTCCAIMHGVMILACFL
jgi:hypothetical protein